MFWFVVLFEVRSVPDSASVRSYSYIGRTTPGGHSAERYGGFGAGRTRTVVFLQEIVPEVFVVRRILHVMSHWSVPARVTKRHVAWYFPQRILLFRSAKAVTSYELVTSKSVPAPVTQAGPTMCIRVIKC